MGLSTPPAAPEIRRKSTSKAVYYLSIPAALLAVIAVSWWAFILRNEKVRADWKKSSLARLATLSITNDEIRQELDSLKADPESLWYRDNVLWMTKGEYLIYTYRHGRNDRWIDHLFLAHSSDGRWLYSTYHFCNSMVTLLSDPPPGSVAEFEARYAIREFDGKSDECLKHTWPEKR